MFILGLNCISDSVFTNTVQNKITYSKVSIMGNCVVDGTHLLNYQMSDEDIKSQNSAPVFNINTIFAGNFDGFYDENTHQYTGSLEAGSLISGVGIPLNRYAIRRKEVGSNLNTLLTEITDLTAHSYIDYTIPSNKLYEYTVTPVFEDETNRFEGRGLLAVDSTSVNFHSYILTDTSTYPPVQYIFDLDVELSDVEIVTDYKVYENYTSFPVVHFSNTEYKKCKFKTMPYRYEAGQGNNGYVIDKGVLDDVIDFLSNKTEKLMRFPNGEMWKCVCSNVSYKYNDDVESQPFSISFEIVQVSDV